MYIFYYFDILKFFYSQVLFLSRRLLENGTAAPRRKGVLKTYVQFVFLLCAFIGECDYIRNVITRVGTLIVATIYLQLIQNRYMFRSFTVLHCSHQRCVQPVASRSQKGLSPCDFDLIPKMKEPIRGIRFRTVPEILQAVDRSIRTINTTGAAKGIL